MTVHLHLGYYKTGTTSLQEYLDRARPRHLAKGLLYPAAARPTEAGSSPHASHSALPFALIDRNEGHLPAWYVSARDSSPQHHTLKAVTEALAVEVAQTTATDIVVSSEEFARFGDTAAGPELAAEVLKCFPGHEVRAICYLKRPDRYLDSWYNQLVKMGLPLERLEDDLDSYLDTIHVDFAMALEPWVQVLGADRITLRNFDDLGPASVVADFMALIGHGELHDPNLERRGNPRFSSLFIEAKRTWNRLSDDSDRFDRAVRKVTDNRLVDIAVPVSTLGPEHRQRLYDNFSPINATLGQIAGIDDGFFPDLDDMLDPPNGAITDLEAFQRVAPYLALALADD